jgi:hypothetical protein
LRILKTFCLLIILKRVKKNQEILFHFFNQTRRKNL